jgi:hypothetical protein
MTSTPLTLGFFNAMKYKNWDDFKVHCTGISRVMSRPKGFNDLTKKDRAKYERLVAIEEKTDEDLGAIAFFEQKRENFFNPPLSEGAKSYLIERYSSEKYNTRMASSGGRQKPKVAKGVALENEGVELISYVDKIKYTQPECAISNDYLVGECDILCHDNNRIVDVKTSWNAASFMQVRRANKLSFNHWCQMQGYLELYDLEHGQTCFVLVNTPEHLIDQEKINLFKRYTFGEITREDYDEQVEKFDSLYDYNKIPISKRIIRFEVPRYREFMPFVYKKIGSCRAFLNEFERTFLKNKNILTLPEDYINAGSPSEQSNTEHNTDEPHQGDSE